MIRSPRFLISQRPYAVDLSALKIGLPSVTGGLHVTIPAAWFRKRKGRTVACLGVLWDVQKTRPASAEEFLRNHDDGRYGGDCRARWDGETFWAHQPALPDVTGPQLEFLRAMLESYPAVPDGFDGWWRFQ